MPSERDDDFPDRRPPRVWTVFVGFLCVLAAVIILQFAVGLLLVMFLLFNGDNAFDPGGLSNAVANPALFILLSLPVQLAIGLAAILLAYFSPVPLKERLGLGRPVLAGWAYPVVLLGSLFPAAVGLALVVLLSRVFEPDATLDQVYANATVGSAVLLFLFLTLFPGFCEEAFFRGYMQRRLLRRWPAWLAILIPSALFALIHFVPHTVVFAFPIGLWLGVLAWRTGSIWPSALSHAFVNGVSCGWDLTSHLADLPPMPPDAVLLPLAAVAFVCFLASVWVVARHPGAVPVQVAFPWEALRVESTG